MKNNGIFNTKRAVTVIAVIVCITVMFLGGLLVYERLTAKKIPKKLSHNLEPWLINELAMLDENAGWAFDVNNYIYRTTQGTQSFEKIAELDSVFVSSDHFVDTCFLNADSAYFSFFEDASRIGLMYTNDGGNQWKTTYLPYDEHVGEVYVSFPDEQTGYLLYYYLTADGASAIYLYQSNNGGESFELSADLSEVISGSPTGISFATDQKGFISVSGEESYLYMTSDFGQTWEHVSLDLSSLPDDPDYVSGMVPVFYGNDRQSGKLVLEYGEGEQVSYALFQTHDSGNTWRLEGTLFYNDDPSYWNRIIYYSFWSDQDGCLIDRSNYVSIAELIH